MSLIAQLLQAHERWERGIIEGGPEVDEWIQRTAFCLEPHNTNLTNRVIPTPEYASLIKQCGLSLEIAKLIRKYPELTPNQIVTILLAYCESSMQDAAEEFNQPSGASA